MSRFANTYCSQCGKDLGPGDEGVSHCSDHARHSPAPWRFLEDGRSEEEPNYCQPLTICGPDDDDLANVYSSDDSTVSITRAEAIANARLIAAAPDLLAALSDLEIAANTVAACYARNPGSFSAALSDLGESAEKAREAIARATGAA